VKSEDVNLEDSWTSEKKSKLSKRSEMSPLIQMGPVPRRHRRVRAAPAAAPVPGSTPSRRSSACAFWAGNLPLLPGGGAGCPRCRPEPGCSGSRVVPAGALPGGCWWSADEWFCAVLLSPPDIRNTIWNNAVLRAVVPLFGEPGLNPSHSLKFRGVYSLFQVCGSIFWTSASGNAVNTVHSGDNSSASAGPVTVLGTQKRAVAA